MEEGEKIQAHILSVWKESTEFFSGRGAEIMLILTDKHLMFIKKTESKMKWWGANTPVSYTHLTLPTNREV